MSEVAAKKTDMVNIGGVLKPKRQAIKKHNQMKPKIQTPQEVAEAAILLVKERRKIEESLDAKIAEYKERLEEVSKELEEAVFQVKHDGHSTCEGDYKLFPQGKTYTNLITKYQDSATKTAQLLKNKGFVGVKVIKNGKEMNEAEVKKPVSPFDWKNYKSQIDWSKDKWDEPKGDDDGVTTHKATAKKPVVDPDAPKRSVGRPKGKYGSYLKADNRTDDQRKAIGDKVHSNPERKKNYADSIAARKEFKDLMNAAIKKRQADIYNKEGK